MPHYPELLEDVSQGVESGQSDCGDQEEYGIYLNFDMMAVHGCWLSMYEHGMSWVKAIGRSEGSEGVFVLLSV